MATLRQLLSNAKSDGTYPVDLFFRVDDMDSAEGDTACYEFDGSTFENSTKVTLMFDSVLDIESIPLSLDDELSEKRDGWYFIPFTFGSFQVGQINYF